MLDQAFRKQVRNALEHLNDIAHLQMHPLLAKLTLAEPGDPRSGAERLRAALQACIEALHPPPHLEPDSRDIRPFLALQLRYVGGMNTSDVACELGISPRQVQREVQKGLDAVADLLWSRYANVPTPLASLERSTEEISSQPIAVTLHAPRQIEGHAPVLEVKLVPPRLPSTLVVRERLLAELDAALHHRLTLLSASAGWGKTTLLGTWASRQAERVAWVSLDALDNSPTRFWVVVIAALRARLPEIGNSALAMLFSPQPPPLSTVLTVLLDELEAPTQPEPLVLILDDYHLINDPAIHEAFTFLVEHLPPHLHVVLASRIDPELPLSRWRVRGDLAEIRTQALHFTAAEASIFFSMTLGEALVEEDVRLLERRTEGWIAGLQLAALALRRREDRATFVQTFTGSHRYLLDYVQDEVFRHQPAHVQRFLLQSAVLSRMNAAVCTAVTGDTNSQALLEWLERNNLFVVPLDEQRAWYRTHDLFREVLLARLHATQPQLAAELNRRAAHWYATEGDIREAITHAMAATDFSFAAELIERVAPELWLSGDAEAVHSWIELLPDDVLRRHARLVLDAGLRLMESVHGAVSASYTRARAQVEKTIARVEALLRAQQQLTTYRSTRLAEVPEPGDELLADVEADVEVELLRRRISLLRALIASRGYLERSDATGLQQLALQVEELVAQEEEVRWQLIGLSINFWLIYSIRGEGALLIPSLVEAKQQAAVAEDNVAILRITPWLAHAYERAGLLHQVEQECLAVLDLMRRTCIHSTTTGYLHYRLASCYYEWNRIEDALASVRQVLHIGRSWQQADLLFLGGNLLMWLLLATGDLIGADQELRNVEELMQQERFATHKGIAVAMRVRYWLAEGSLAAATDWAGQVTFTQETWNANRKFEFLLWIRVFLAQRQYSQALRELEHFSTYLDRPGDKATAIDFLALRVVALYSGGQAAQAREVAARLVAMTQQAGYIRVYLEAGEPMRQVLHSLLAAYPNQEDAFSSGSVAYISQLLAAFELEGKQDTRPPGLAPLGSSASIESLTEPLTRLTRREQEVLRLLVAGASNQEIAAELVISMATVKKHVGNLLGKLGLANRAQVIVRARGWFDLP